MNFKIESLQASRLRFRGASPRSTRRGLAVARIAIPLLLCTHGRVFSQAVRPTPHDLTQVSLEDLMNIDVTSVSKKDEKLAKTAAAVYVITQEDIRSSGATNIPDLLRMVPGVDVAQITSNTWAIAIRGFNTRYSDKVLVLIDGRSVYAPSYSGVYWDQQDVPLEDIDRIEVIRGPGGNTWGANAMNGVINIITKSSKDTQGGLVVAGAASGLTAEGLTQYGGTMGNFGTYRVFAKYFNIDSSTLPDGSRAADGWHGIHGGFRSDWTLSPRDSLTLEGDLLETGEGQTLTTLFSDRLPNLQRLSDLVTVGSGDLLGRWNRTLSNGAGIQLQVYYDHFNRLSQGVHESIDTIDFDFQHHLFAGARNDIVWGVGYRLMNDTIAPGYNASVDPPRLVDSLYSTFLEDEVRLTNSMWLTLGAKLEHNAFSGLEFEPGARLAWTPTNRHTLWLAISRPIREPARVDVGVRYDTATVPFAGGGFGLVEIVGNPKTSAETMMDYEAGYRAQLTNRLSLDIAAFRSLYESLETAEPGAPFLTDNPTPAHLVLPQILDNRAYARSYGAEIFGTWNVTSRWRLSPGYSIVHLDVETDAASHDLTARAVEGDTPKHQVQLRSMYQLGRGLEWDTSVYSIGALDGGHIPGFTRVDSRLGWRIGESLEFSVGGQNLLAPRHFEFENAFEVNRTYVERSVVGRITWRF